VSSNDLPITPGAVQPKLNNGTGNTNFSDGFLFVLDATGSSDIYSTYIGGSGEEDYGATSPVVDSAGHVYLAGSTQSTDFPVTPGAYQQSNAGGIYGSYPQWGDAYLAKIELPSHLYGTGTPGCLGTQTIGVNSPPSVGNAALEIVCNHNPSNTLGLLLIATNPDLAGSDPFGLGVLLHVDLLSPELLAFNLYSDHNGNAAASTPIPNNPNLAGATYSACALWYWSQGSCNASPFQLSSSRGLSITIVQ
jgi:hypothetical protein